MIDRSHLLGWIAATALLAGHVAAQGVLSPHNLTPVPRDSGPTPDYQPKLPPPYGGPKAGPFYKLDKVVGTHLNMNNAVFSPVAIHPNGNWLAAVNPRGNAVRIFDISNPDPTLWTVFKSLRTAWGPVSCAFWNDPQCDAELLVTCSNSDALLWLSNGGQVHGLLGLPGEPSDLLVDHARNRAWVSCMATDVVVEIDLIEKRIRGEYPIPSKHPAFLAFEAGSTGDVIVAPMLSGNNTTVDRGQAIFNAGPDGILDLTAATQGLPDEDLFRLGYSKQTVEPVVTGAGTVLFEHGPNPATGAWWMLGTQARNFAFQSEPAANGIFSENRLAIVNGLPSGGAVPPSQLIDLDDSNRLTPTIEYDPTRTVGQPCSLAFDSAGHGFITGMLTDNVTELDATGAFVQEWNVGSIPRGADFVHKAGKDLLLVYCWGSSTIEVYHPALGTGLVARLRVGTDPTHPTVAAGRTLFYSAASSQYNNLSCNTCHVDGFSDLLAWDLSDRRRDSSGEYTVPVDDKGPLVTQTLRNIKGQGPFHWRGERSDLVDFNGAFAGLLGGTPLDETPGGDFDKFEAFVMTLQERANPFESPRRRVSDKFVTDDFPPGTSAVRGQDIFYFNKSLPNRACETCHALPSGTLNTTFRDEADASSAGESHFVVAPLMSFWRKLQPGTVDIEYADGTPDTLPVLGVSLAMTGLADNLQDFVFQGGFTLSTQDKHDVAAFLQQLDTGFPPLMHKGVRIGYGANCQPPSPLVSGGAGPFSSGTSAGLSGTGATSGAPPGSLPMSLTSGSVQPGIVPGIVDELTANSVSIQFLAGHAKNHGFDLMVVAELQGTAVEGLYDPDAQVFPLADAALATTNLTTPQLIQALETKELVGMVFPLPRGQGIEYQEFDPDSGVPGVVPGPGATSDPNDDGNGGADGEAPVGYVPGPIEGETSQAGPRAPVGGTRLPANEMTGPPVISGYELVWVTAKVAKFVFFTNVPTRSRTEYTPQGGSMRVQVEPLSRRAHTVYLRDLDPSVGWDLRVVVTDAALMTSELVVPNAFTTLDLLLPDHVKVSSLAPRAPDQDSAGTLRFTVDVEVKQLSEALAVDYTPTFDVLVLDASTQQWRVDQIDVQAPTTDTTGQTFFELIVNGLAANDEVLVVVRDVLPPTGFYEWSLPDTPSENRAATVVYTGTGP